MPLAQEIFVVVPESAGITAALVAFVLLCMAFPGIVRHRFLFTWAFILVLVLILLHCLSLPVRHPGFLLVSGLASGVIQIAALLLFFLASGGTSARELRNSLLSGVDTILRGEEGGGTIAKSGPPPAAQSPPAPSPAPGGPPADPDKTVRL